MPHRLYRSLYLSGARASLGSRRRDLEVSTLTSNCGAENIALSMKSSLARSEDLLPLLRQNEVLVDVFIESVARSHILDG